MCACPLIPRGGITTVHSQDVVSRQLLTDENTCQYWRYPTKRITPLSASFFPSVKSPAAHSASTPTASKRLLLPDSLPLKL